MFVFHNFYNLGFKCKIFIFECEVAFTPVELHVLLIFNFKKLKKLKSLKKMNSISCELGIFLCGITG